MSEFGVKSIMNELRRRLIDIGRGNDLIHFPPRPASRKAIRLIDDNLDRVHTLLAKGDVQIIAEKILPKIEDPTPRTVPLGREGGTSVGEGSPRPFRRMAKSFTTTLPVDDARYDLLRASSSGGLQSDLPQDELDGRLLGIARDHASRMAETGVGQTCAVLGTLEWPQDPRSAQHNISPLLLMQLSIEKTVQSSRHVHTLGSDEGETHTNAALREALRNDYGIELPGLLDEESPSAYLKRIEAIVKDMPGFRVKHTATIALMKSIQMAIWRDLDLERWSETAATGHRLLPTLLGVEACADRTGHFEGDHDVPGLMDQSMALVPPIIYDADTSQHSAIIDMMDGHDVAIEGPPGSGKSQTIANMIASAVSKGRTILFVAEKKTALDVVAARLRERGFGDLILELHGTNASKAEVAASLYRRIQAEPDGDMNELSKTRSALRTKTVELRNHLRATTSMLADGGDLHDRIWGSIDLSSRLGIDVTRLATLMPEPSAVSDPKTCGVALAEHLEAQALVQTMVRPDDAWSVIPVSETLDTGLVKAHAVQAAIRMEAVDSASLDGVLGRWLPTLKECQTVLSLQDKATSIRSSGRMLRTVLSEHDRVVKVLETTDAFEEVVASVCTLDPALMEADPDDLMKVVEIAGDLGIRTASDLERDLRTYEEHHKASERVRHVLERAAAYLSIDVVSLKTEDLSQIREALSKYVKLDDRTAKIGRISRGGDWLAKIQVCAGQVSSLKGEHEKLLRHVHEDMAREAIIDDLEADIAIIREAGVLARLGKPYRAAVARIVGLMVDKCSDLEFAIRRAGDVISLRRRCEAVEKDPVLRGMLPQHLWVDGEPDFQEAFSAKTAYDDALTGMQRSGLAADRIAGMSFPDVNSYREDLAELANALAMSPAKKTISSYISDSEEYFSKAQNLDFALRRSKIKNTTVLSSEMIDHASRFRSAHERRQGALNEFPSDTEELRQAMSDMRHILAFDFSPDVLDFVLSHEVPTEAIGTVMAAVKNRHDRQSKVYDDLSMIERLTGAPLTDLCGSEIASIRTWVDVSGRLRALNSDHSGYDARVRLSISLQEIDRLEIQQVAAYAIGVGARPQDIADAYLFRSMRQVTHQAIATSVEFTRRARPHHVTLDQARSEVRRLDAEMQRIEAQDIVATRIERTQRVPGIGKGPAAEWTERPLVDREITKQRKHVPLRELVRRAGAEVLALKPIWLMSPSTVAQFLPKRPGMFDLLVIDEASQMLPEYAIGALMRSSQAVVVGDPNQMPPNTGFTRAATGEDSEAAEAVEDVESILDMANRSFPKRRRLKWHYRSQHPSLIAFSNLKFYNSDLVISPSAAPKDVDLGVHFHLVEKPSYHGGLNLPEADEVVRAVASLVRSHPQHSLAVVAMNGKQAEYISEQIELLELDDDLYKQHAARHANESARTIVVSLENCQGHERDIVLLSMLYGPEIAGGKVAQQFAGINSASGHRRLNVMATRAKRAIHVFSSIRANEIKGGSVNRGVDDYKAYLQYAEDGLLIESSNGRAEPESAFERVVGEALRDAGYGVTYQVGAKGFSIDIGVARRSGDSGFMAGIECDGAPWHRGLSVRERDRIRQGVLEGLGWQIYRIWSTDWYHDPKTETRRMIEWLRSIPPKRSEPLLHIVEKFDEDPVEPAGASLVTGSI